MSEKRRDILVAGLLALLPLLFFPGVATGRRDFFIRDVAHWYHPVKKMLRELVLRGERPWWNPYFLGGQPLAANPDHNVFYPLNWLILLPDYQTGFRVLILLHVSIGLVSMYALLRSMELRRPAAFLGATAYGLGGMYLSYTNLLPILFQAAWLPLTCLFARRFFHTRRARDFALAALALGLQFLSFEPASIAQTALLVAAYCVYRTRSVRALVLALAIGVAGLAAGAAQVLPAIDHAFDSIRGRGLPYSSVSLWSMPPVKLVELVYPNFLGHVVTEGRFVYWGDEVYGRAAAPYLYGIYSGLLIAVMAAAGFATRMRGALFAAILCAISIVLALGDHTPLLRMLYALGVTSLRYYEKFLLPAVFTLIVFGAHALDRLLDGDERLRRAALALTLTVTAVAAFLALFAGTDAYASLFTRGWNIEPGPFTPYLLELSRRDWIAASIRGGALLLLLLALPRIKRAPWVAAASLFMLADLAPLAREIAPTTDASLYRSVPIAAQKLRQIPGDFRLFPELDWRDDSPEGIGYRRMLGPHYEPFRNALVPEIAAGFGIETVMESDYDRTALLPTVDFLDVLQEVLQDPPPGWPQPLAAMSNAWFRAVYRPVGDAVRLARGDLRNLQPAAILPLDRQPRYYFAGRMASIRDWREFAHIVRTYPVTNDTAFVYGGAFPPAAGVVHRSETNANRIRLDVESSGRGFLVIGVTPHKYWRVTIDGRRVTPAVTNVGYQGVEIGPGRHVVEMRYRNPLIAIGGAISLLAAAFLVALTMRAR